VATAQSTTKGATRRRPFVFGRIFRFVLRDFFVSLWPLFMLAVLAAVHVLLFTSSPTREHFFGVQYVTTMLMAALASAAFFGRAGRAEWYAILARPVSRGSLTLALLLGAWLVTILAYLVSTAAVMVRFGPWLEPEMPVTLWLDAQVLGMGSVPVALAALLVVSLVALLSHFVASTGLRLVVLALIALLVMAFDSRNFPFTDIRPTLEQIPPVITPVADALRFATTPAPTMQTTYSLIALAAYALALFLLVLLVSVGRETVLD
jgi:hypothetical protein